MKNHTNSKSGNKILDFPSPRYYEVYESPPSAPSLNKAYIFLYKKFKIYLNNIMNIYFWVISCRYIFLDNENVKTQIFWERNIFFEFIFISLQIASLVKLLKMNLPFIFCFLTILAEIWWKIFPLFIFGWEFREDFHLRNDGSSICYQNWIYHRWPLTFTWNNQSINEAPSCHPRKGFFLQHFSCFINWFPYFHYVVWA